MSTNNFYQVHEAKPRIPINLIAVAKELQKEFIGHTRAEIIDALTTAQYDISTARQLIQEAERQGVCLSVYLAQIEEVQGDR